MARKRGGGGHAGGGHGWFVTFADLMALMMSFFVMLVAFSTPNQKKMQVVAGSMREAFGIQAHKHAEQQGEADQRTAAVTEERQGDPDHRCQPDGHAHIDHQVQEQDACRAVRIDARET